MRRYTADGVMHAGFDRRWQTASVIVVAQDEDSYDLWALDNDGPALDAWLRYYNSDGVKPYFFWRVYHTHREPSTLWQEFASVCWYASLVMATIYLVGTLIAHWRALP